MAEHGHDAPDLTLDSWSSGVVRHVVTNQPEMVIFFIFFLMVTVFGVMNLVVAVIVQQTVASAASNQDKMKVRQERARRTELDNITTIFNLADKSGDRCVDAMEFLQACGNQEVRELLYQLQLPVDDALRLFTVMDGDGSRALHEEEFKDGCLKLKGVASSKDMLQILSQADTLAMKMNNLDECLCDTERDMALLEDVVWRIYKRFGPTVKASRNEIARKVVGQCTPLKPIERDKPGENSEAPLSIGNRPALPAFPDFLY